MCNVSAAALCRSNDEASAFAVRFTRKKQEAVFGVRERHLARARMSRAIKFLCEGSSFTMSK